MAKEFDQESLRKYYLSNDIDFSWMEKPSQHQFRWRDISGRWMSSSRRIRDHETLLKAIKNQNPTDIYFSTSSWLNPIELPRLSDKDSPKPVLIDHLIVFDIDIPPFSIKNIEIARKIAVGLHLWISQNYDFELKNISFSGSKGFHLMYKDNDRSLFSIENLIEREKAVRENRENIVERVLSNGFEIDKKVTQDTRRIIRMPGTVHGKTGWKCHRIDFETLSMPFTSWLEIIPKHEQAIKIPKKAKRTTKKKVKTKSVKISIQSEEITSLEVSNHLPGTKNRSALICWLPKSWGLPEQAIEKAKLMMEKEKMGSCGFWLSDDRILMICPRSISRSQLIKILNRNGLKRLSEELKNKDHYWTRISGVYGSSTGWEEQLEPINVLGKDLDISCSWQWSSAHLELSSRMGLNFEYDSSNISGTEEPSIRAVVRE